jgi:hypothetical protein
MNGWTWGNQNAYFHQIYAKYETVWRGKLCAEDLK